MQFNISETGRFLHYKVTLKSVLFKKGTGKQSCYMRQILCFFFFLLFYYFPPTWLASGHPIQSDATLTIKTTAIQLISSQASPKQQQHNASRHYKVPYTLFLWQIQTSSLFFFFRFPHFQPKGEMPRHYILHRGGGGSYGKFPSWLLIGIVKAVHMQLRFKLHLFGDNAMAWYLSLSSSRRERELMQAYLRE